MHLTKVLSRVPVKPLRKVVSHRRNYAERAYVHMVGKGPLLYRNLGEQLQLSAEKYGKRTALISRHECIRLSFEEARDQARILVVKLKGLDMKMGEQMGIWLPNTSQLYISWLASAMGGFILVSINSGLEAPEMAYTLKKSKVKVLMTMDESGDRKFHEILKKLLPNLKDGREPLHSETFPALRRIVLKMKRPLCEFINYDELLKTPTSAEDIEAVNATVSKISPEAPCNIQFTSGTTGLPKATVLTHFNFVNIAHFTGVRINVQDRHLIVCLPMPIFHAIALGTMVFSLEYGATLVLSSATLNGAKVLEAIEEEGCNVVVGAPTLYVDMLQAQAKLKKSLKSLQTAFVGGSACSPVVYAKSKEVFGLKEMIIGYGQTEATAGIVLHDGTEDPAKAAFTVGRVFSHGEAKVINEKGETVGFGEPGELCVRGFFTMNGYFEDEKSTREVLTVDGWLKTGDEFIIQQNGVFHIIGRKKEMIIRGGENLFPKEIEDFLDTHEHVAESQVIGVPDDRLGEQVCAFLRLKPGAPKLTEADVKTFCKGNLAYSKIPRYVRFVDKFPKSNMGKIKKLKLLELFKKK